MPGLAAIIAPARATCMLPGLPVAARWRMRAEPRKQLTPRSGGQTALDPNMLTLCLAL